MSDKDTIYRQDAIDALKIRATMNGRGDGKSLTKLVAFKVANDYADYVRKRIEERLPEATENILICDIDEDIYLGHRTRYNEYYPDFCGDRIKNVIAWMPLPEPYKEDAS